MAAISPYRTALLLNRPAPAHVSDDDQNRIVAYNTYEDVWNNIPEAFEALLRIGDDPKARRLIPAARGLVESINRYLGMEPEVAWVPIPGAEVNEDDQNEFLARMNAFLAREEFHIKLLAMKRWWLIKGDSMLALSADPSKDQGSRISINEIPAEQYFPIYDPADGEKRLGCYLVSIVKDDDNEDIVQRIEYRRVLTEEQAGEFGVPVGSVFYRLGFFELDGWDDREPDGELKPVDTPAWADSAVEPSPLTGYALPAQIKTIPVYHFRNNRRGGLAGRFGTSELQGLETILAGMIQNASDEDQSIAFMGIGMYWTDSGRPMVNGKEAEWELSPGTVLEMEKDGKFGRVTGVDSVQPMLDHLNMLKSEARDAAAIPAVAAGARDPNADQSGVALRIEFMPVIAKNAEKEQELSSKLTQLMYDLIYMWFPAYEGWTPPLVQPSVLFGDPLPVDRAATLKEILDLVAAQVVSREWAAKEIAARLGYKFDADMLATIAAEQETLLDSAGMRIADEAGNEV